MLSYGACAGASDAGEGLEVGAMVGAVVAAVVEAGCFGKKKSFIYQDLNHNTI